MTGPFDSEGLWFKSRLFINRSQDDFRDFEERAFWACSALELLGKSAMSRVSPLLVANPNDDGKSLLVASGVGKTSEATSVQAKAVWARCGRLFKPFNATEASLLAIGRNDYIHSATVGFEPTPERVWWPSFWSQAVILLQHLDKSVIEYVGPTAAAHVAIHLATQKNNNARQLEARLERARSALARHHAGTLTARLAAEWATFSFPESRYSVETVCPACASELAILGGDEKNMVTVENSEDDEYGFDTTIVTLEINTEYLACSSCQLVITEYELLVEAGIEMAFDTDGTADDIEREDYNNE